MKFKQGVKWLSISAILAVVSIGSLIIYGLFIKISTQTVTVSIVTVTKGKVENKITGENGILKLDNQRTIKSTIIGTVEEILVKEGDMIKKGQILIRLRDKETQIKLQVDEANLKDKTAQLSDKYLTLQQAESKLVKLTQQYQNDQNTSLKEIQSTQQKDKWEIEKSKLDFNKKQQAINQAESELAEAKVTLGEDKQLFAKGFISENDLKKQEKAVAQVEINVSNAENDLSTSKIDLENKELDLQNFLKSVEKNSSESQKKLKDTQDKVEQFQQEVSKAKLDLNQAIRDIEKLKIQRQTNFEELRKTVITSPIDGVILNLLVKLGDVIEDKGDVVIVGDPSQRNVELKLSPLDATKVKLNQKAEINIVGLESKKITGKVQQISLLVRTSEGQGNNQGSDNGKVTVLVQLDRVNQEIVSGTPVTVVLIVSQREKVLVLPSEAIQQTESESESFVWMQDTQGKAVKKNIKIGLEGLDNVEIKSGLKLGDKILIPAGDNKLNEGDYVMIKNN